MYVLGVSLFRPRADIWAPKAPERTQNVIEEVVRMHVVEHAKTMAGTVREAYVEIPGRVQEALFSERGTKASPWGC